MSASKAVASRQGGLPIDAEASRGKASQYLVFSLQQEAFAIDILCIREIIEYSQLTQVPLMPATVRGVLNLRGAVVPVIDLALRFGRSGTEIGRRTAVVIVEVQLNDETQTLGILVDAVNQVLEIPAQDIEPPPSFGARIRADFINGMGKVDGKFVIMLNMGKVLSVQELAELARLE